MTDIEIVTEGARVGELEHLTTFASAHPEIKPHYSGTVRYLAGRIAVMGINPFDPTDPITCSFVHSRTMWAVLDGVYLRVQGFDGGGGGPSWLRVDQSAPAQLFLPGGGYDMVRLVEPSPPTDVQQWWRAELERAARERDAFADMARTVDEILTRPDTDGGGR